MPARFDDNIAERLIDVVPVAVRNATKRLENDLKSEVPRDQGGLEDDVTSGQTSRGRVGQVGFGSEESFYWRFVNDGTSKQDGQHFVEKALEANTNTIAEEAQRAARGLLGG